MGPRSPGFLGAAAHIIARQGPRSLEATLPIVSVAAAFPEQYYPQAQTLALLDQQWKGAPHARARVASFHENAGVEGRHLALPIERYPELRDFSERNREYIRCAVELGERALGAALREAELPAAELGHLFFVSVTGMATPSIDARLVNRMRLNPALKRTPIFGLGCVAGAAGLARAADWARAYPESSVALLAVELCSLTWQADDLSVPNLLACSLFGDGAAALVLAGGGRTRGPRVLASRSRFYADTEHVMGWEIGTQGLKVVLSAGVPELVRQHARADVDAFLAEQSLQRADIQHWVLHTGGPRVLEAFQTALDLSAEDLEFSWQQLRRNGNLSSASVLLVLGDLWRTRKPASGERALLMAMGPGFCSEMVLLQW